MKSQKIDRTGVLVIMSHLIITLALIVGYIVFTVLDKPVGTIETALFMVLAYWFGAMGNNIIRPNAQTQIHNAQEVKVGSEQNTPPPGA